MVEVWTCVHWGSGPCEGVATQISNVEHHGVLVEAELGRELLYLALNGVPCIFMHLLEIVDSGTCVHVCVLL